MSKPTSTTITSRNHLARDLNARLREGIRSGHLNQVLQRAFNLVVLARNAYNREYIELELG